MSRPQDAKTIETPWIEAPTLVLDAGLPVARRFDAVSETLIDRGRELLATISAFLPPSYRRLAMLAALRTGHRFTAEAKSLATRVGTDWRAVFVANLSYDMVIASLGCSTVALATSDGPILARNMDWAPERAMAQASVRIDLVREGNVLHRTANWPGGIGVVTGLSGRGFAVAINAVFHPGGIDRLGYPVLLFLRRLLDEATGFADVLRRLATQRLMTAGLFTLVGRDDRERVVVERSPRRAALRWASGDSPLVSTNHYQSLPVEAGPLAFGLTGTSADRCAALTDLVSIPGGNVIDDAQLLFMLTDPDVMQSITAQHVVARPHAGTLRVYAPRRLIAN
ncbi:MAG: C45 family peptidase [Planctomycetaceae bacterium]